MPLSSIWNIYICLPRDWVDLLDAFRGNLIFRVYLPDSRLLVCSHFPGSFLSHKVTLLPKLAGNSWYLASVLKCCYFRHLSAHLLY